MSMNKLSERLKKQHEEEQRKNTAPWTCMYIEKEDYENYNTVKNSSPVLVKVKTEKSDKGSREIPLNEGCGLRANFCQDEANDFECSHNKWMMGCYVLCDHPDSFGIVTDIYDFINYEKFRQKESLSDIQEISYRVFELIEPAIKQAIGQALEEHL